MMETFTNVWDALESRPEEAARMTIIADLMVEMTKVIRRSEWDKAEAARHFHSTYERMDDLLQGRIDLFELDELVRMVAAYGRKVRIEIEAA